MSVGLNNFSIDGKGKAKSPLFLAPVAVHTTSTEDYGLVAKMIDMDDSCCSWGGLGAQLGLYWAVFGGLVALLGSPGVVLGRFWASWRGGGVAKSK